MARQSSKAGRRTFLLGCNKVYSSQARGIFRTARQEKPLRAVPGPKILARGQVARIAIHRVLVILSGNEKYDLFCRAV